MTGHATWFAPGRVNLIGDHTDYQLGWAMPFAIADGLTVTVDLTDTSSLEVTSSQLGTVARPLTDLPAGPCGWAAYVDGAVELLTRGQTPQGLRVTITGALPEGGGLASSAAITCAVVAATGEAIGRRLDRSQLAEMAQSVENDYVGAGVGYLDPAAVMFGRAGQVLLLDARTKRVEPLPCDLAAERLALLVVDTRQRHRTSGASYSQRVAQCCAAASELAVPSLRDVADVEAVEAIGDPLVRARARHVVSENHRVLTVAALLQTGRLSQVGDLLLASHQSLRDDFEVSTAALDAVVEAAMAAGALGARVTGAGFGGSALVLVADHRADDVSAAVMDAFARKGWDSPTIMPVTPSDGARNLMAAEDSADGSRDPDV